MDIMRKTTVLAAIIGATAAFAMPAAAAPDKDQCKAEFKQISPEGDMSLDSEQGKKYSQVATKVDVNEDGMISADEYIVACTKDVFKKMDKS